MTLVKPKRILYTSMVLWGFFLTILSLKLYSSFITIPYVWISLIWFCITLCISLSSSSSKIKVIFFNTSLFVLCFGIAEIFFWQMSEADGGAKRVVFRDSNNNTIKFTVEHDILGYAPIKNAEVFVTQYWKDGLKVNSKYTTDYNGLRISNANNNLGYSKGIIFFGCSYTFGASINDEETLPFQVGKQIDHEYKISNFGFPGYGTHQMLAAIEHGLVEITVDTNIKYAIYQALPDHINRLLGWRKWDTHGPRYILDIDKKIKNVGQFDDNQSFLTTKLKSQLEKSYIYGAISAVQTGRKVISSNDIDLFAGMVRKSRNLLKELYPGIEFHVIFWDIGPWIVPKELQKNILQGLEKEINIHLITDILVDYDEKKYLMNKYDSHPNSLANKIIAEYVVKKIIK